MYRKVSGLMTCIILALSFVMTTYAGELVIPRWTYASDISNSLSISDSGLASANASITAKSSNSDAVKIVSSLQQNKNGSWATLKTWEQSKDGVSTALSGSLYVTKGYSYRLSTTYYVYSGGKLAETVTNAADKDYK